MASAPWSSPTASSPARSFGSGCATITAAHSSPSPSHNRTPEPALSFIIQVVLARRIGIESYGLYAYAISWVSFLSMLALMGGDRVLVRYLPEYDSVREHGLFRGVLAWMAGTGLAVSVTAGLRFLHPRPLP